MNDKVDLSNLKVGMEIKNYKELCSILGEKVGTGKSKQIQLEKWTRYFDYERKGNKYIINKIYSVPLPELKKDISKKKISKNDLYTKYVQIIITKYLKETEQRYYTTTDLLKILGFVNNNWGDLTLLEDYCKETGCTPRQAKYYYNQLYMHVMSYCTTAFKRCLNRLSQRKFITWYEAYRVCDIDTFGNISQERNATEEEIDLYTEISFKLKEEMGIALLNIYNAEKYYDELNKRLKQQGLIYMHKTIAISFAKSGIDKAIEISKQEYIEARKNVNEKSLNQMKKYIDTDIERAIENKAQEIANNVMEAYELNEVFNIGKDIALRTKQEYIDLAKKEIDIVKLNNDKIKLNSIYIADFLMLMNSMS